MERAACSRKTVTGFIYINDNCPHFGFVVMYLGFLAFPGAGQPRGTQGQPRNRGWLLSWWLILLLAVIYRCCYLQTSNEMPAAVLAPAVPWLCC